MSTHGMGTLQEHWYEAGAAVAFGLMGMAEAIANNDAVKACPHCGIAGSRCYCDCSMCGPGECFYWICKPCFDAGRRFGVRESEPDRSVPRGE